MLREKKVFVHFVELITKYADEGQLHLSAKVVLFLNINL
jgi:hypothetical protein